MSRARQRWAFVVVAVLGSGARSRVGAEESRFTATIGAGVAYPLEAWTPGGGNAGSTYFGWAEAVDVALARKITPRLSLGASWAFSSLVDPQETYLSTTAVASDSVRVVNSLSGLVDYLVVPRLRINAGATVGLVGRTIWDRYLGSHVTAWGFGVGARVGWARPISRRWTLGVVAEASIYRISADDVLPFGHSVGIVPALLVVARFQ